MPDWLYPPAWLDLASLAALAAAALFGGLVLFTVVVAPQIFGHLGRREAGAIMQVLFPAYYAAIAVSATVAAGLLAAHQDHPVEVTLLAAIALGGLIARRTLAPAMTAARRATLEGALDTWPRFRRLHATAMALNLAQLVAAGFVVLRIAP